MTPALTEPQIERYSRQILLPEVGGRGQARLLSGRVAIAGDTGAARVAALLIARAGVGKIDLLEASDWPADGGPDCRMRDITIAEVADTDVVVDLAGDSSLTTMLAARATTRPYLLGSIDGLGATLATLVGRPCPMCVPREAVTLHRPAMTDPLVVPLTLALGALAASEAVSVLLTRPTAGRLQTLGVGDGSFSARALAPAERCSTCGAGA
jgi:molybdopterin/thiamine biosynthesis adenylyltransferase